MSERLSLQEAKEQIREDEYHISDLINPEDLNLQDVENWGDADVDLLRDEIGMGLSEWSYPYDHPYEDLILDLAIDEFVDDMIRVPFDHLVFESREECVIQGYWLYDMSRNEVTELVYENREEFEFLPIDRVMMEIESAILDARLADID